MAGFEFPKGNIQMVGKSQGPMYKGEKLLEAGLAPEWTLDKLALHAVDCWLSTEDLPMPNNRVTVDGQGTITLSYTPPTRFRSRSFTKLKSMLNSMDIHDHLIPPNVYMKNEIGIGGVAHQAGTCRFGTDPKSSVLDTNCKAHELDTSMSSIPAFSRVSGRLTQLSRLWRTRCGSAITSSDGLNRGSIGAQSDGPARQKSWPYVALLRVCPRATFSGITHGNRSSKRQQ
jgi:GMC oxidoreductase